MFIALARYTPINLLNNMNPRALYPLCILLVAIATCSLVARAEAMSDIPTTRFKVSTEAGEFTRLSDTAGFSIAATGGAALISGNRSMSFLRKGSARLEKVSLDGLPPDANWFSPICAAGRYFVVAVDDYSAAQQDKESNSPRGSFRVGPKAKGFLVVSPGQKNRYLSSLRVTSRPPFHFEGDDTRSAAFADYVQSCAWNGQSLYLGSYGSLGIANIDKETIELVSEDEEEELSRLPLIIDGATLWYGIDEGGLDGAAIVKRTAGKEEKSWAINNGEDIVSYTALAKHQGQLLVGTSHGLFQLDEKAGRFQRLDVDPDVAGRPITSLTSQGGFLWVFAEGEWLKVDLKRRTTVRYVDRAQKGQANFTAGIFFDGAWLLVGPDGIWRASVR